jgi:hypothetical protein
MICQVVSAPFAGAKVAKEANKIKMIPKIAMLLVSSILNSFLETVINTPISSSFRIVCFSRGPSYRSLQRTQKSLGGFISALFEIALS